MFPYIGITDFTNIAQVLKMSHVFRTHNPRGSERKLHVGVMMSRKTLRDMPTMWHNIFPPKERVAHIFRSLLVYNCLHYADYEHSPNLWKDLADAIRFGGNRMNALQLDMIWPDPAEVEKGVGCNNIEVILQIGKQAFERAKNTPQEIVRRLSSYDGVIHRVLLDKSMGKGIRMDANGLRPFILAIKESFPRLGITVAGGLGPDTLDLVEPLVREFPDLSIDAQGQLRPSANIQDPIDWGMAEAYLIKAIGIFPQDS